MTGELRVTDVAKVPSSFKLLERNVIVIRIQKGEQNRERYFDSELCGRLCVLLGITPQGDTLGFQTRMERGLVVVEVWLKSHILAEKYTSETICELCPGFTIMGVNPAIVKEVSLLISGLPFNVSDDEVRDYVQKFGGKITTPTPQLCTFRDGPWKGQYNGDRRYRVDFSGQKRPMGSFHILGGTRVKVVYTGNTSTCGRCQGYPTECPGGGIAGRCRENGGQMVPLGSHMRQVLQELEQVRPPTSEAPLFENSQTRSPTPNEAPPSRETLPDTEPAASHLPADQLLASSQPEAAKLPTLLQQAATDQSEAPMFPNLPNSSQSEVSKSSTSEVSHTTPARPTVVPGISSISSNISSGANLSEHMSEVSDVSSCSTSFSMTQKSVIPGLHETRSAKKKRKKKEKKARENKKKNEVNESEVEKGNENDVEKEKDAFASMMASSNPASFFEDDKFKVFGVPTPYTSHFARRLSSSTPRARSTGSSPHTRTRFTPKRPRTPSPLKDSKSTKLA